jgi:hypothetical protein
MRKPIVYFILLDRTSSRIFYLVWFSDAIRVLCLFLLLRAVPARTTVLLKYPGLAWDLNLVTFYVRAFVGMTCFWMAAVVEGWMCGAHAVVLFGYIVLVGLLDVANCGYGDSLGVGSGFGVMLGTLR